MLTAEVSTKNDQVGREIAADQTRSLFSSLFNLNSNQLALSIVRITFHAIVFLSIFQIYYCRRLSFAPSCDWIGDFVVLADLVLVASLMVGYKIRFCAIAHYLLFTALIYPNCLHRYHFDYVTGNFSLLFMFAPAAKTLSVDSRLKGIQAPGELLPRWFFFLYFTAIWLFYVDSVLFKVASPMWTGGITFWFGAALPHFSLHMYPEWLEIDWVVKMMTYTAFVFEATFPLILFSRLRPVMVLFGFLLHLGITLFYPIPLFGVGMAVLFLFYFNYGQKATPAGSSKTADEFETPPWLGYGLIGLLMFTQILLILPKEQKPPFTRFLMKALHIHRHPVYVDAHFVNPNPLCRFVTTVDGKEVEIPTFSKDGYPIYPAVEGRYWVATTFRMRGPAHAE
ncbi:MAG: HTTM domain-containing protein, partial [Cyanobacteria bacterium]|nr:HTTM domain-containing protein [Cyanobacteriota bacterium]